MQFCDQTCRWCFHQWVKWLKSRMHQMDMAWDGTSTSFNQAAATSVKPPKE